MNAYELLKQADEIYAVRKTAFLAGVEACCLQSGMSREELVPLVKVAEELLEGSGDLHDAVIKTGATYGGSGGKLRANQQSMRPMQSLQPTPTVGPSGSPTTNNPPTPVAGSAPSTPATKPKAGPTGVSNKAWAQSGTMADSAGAIGDKVDKMDWSSRLEYGTRHTLENLSSIFTGATADETAQAAYAPMKEYQGGHATPQDTAYGVDEQGNPRKTPEIPQTSIQLAAKMREADATARDVQNRAELQYLTTQQGLGPEEAAINVRATNPAAYHKLKEKFFDEKSQKWNVPTVGAGGYTLGGDYSAGGGATPTGSTGGATTNIAPTPPPAQPPATPNPSATNPSP